MKNLILIIALLAASCTVNEPLPIRDGVGVSGFNEVWVTSDSSVDFFVYSGKSEISNGIFIYTDNKLTLFLNDGFYTYQINEVFYNEFAITNGIVSNLEVRTY